MKIKTDAHSLKRRKTCRKAQMPQVEFGIKEVTGKCPFKMERNIKFMEIYTNILVNKLVTTFSIMYIHSFLQQTENLSEISRMDPRIWKNQKKSCFDGNTFKKSYFRKSICYQVILTYFPSLPSNNKPNMEIELKI